MSLPLKTLLLLSWLAVASLADTANTRRLQEGQTSPPATVEQLRWLEGDWLGEGLGGRSAETWQPAHAGSMIGLFRQDRDGEAWFYEFMLLLDHEGTVQLRLKHFSPDGAGWEEKDEYLTFDLVSLEPNVAYFDGLTYRRDGDEMHIYLAMKHEGKVEEVAFRLQRVKE